MSILLPANQRQSEGTPWFPGRSPPKRPFLTSGVDRMVAVLIPDTAAKFTLLKPLVIYRKETVKKADSKPGVKHDPAWQCAV